jgi:hypothetical protein
MADAGVIGVETARGVTAEVFALNAETHAAARIPIPAAVHESRWGCNSRYRRSSTAQNLPLALTARLPPGNVAGPAA